MQNQCTSSVDGFHQFLELLESSGTSTTDLQNSGDAGDVLESGIVHFDDESCRSMGSMPGLPEDAELLSAIEPLQFLTDPSLLPSSFFSGVDNAPSEIDLELCPLLNSTYAPESYNSASECEAFVANLLALS